MKVLMISIDRGLLGKGQLGDVIERHRRYGEQVDKLDIIVFCQKEFEINKISGNVTVYPTNSCCKLRYCYDAKKIGEDLFEKNKYNLIVAQTPFITGLVGYKLKKKFGAKLLVHFHGDFWQNRNWLKERKQNFIFLLISKFVVSKADGIRVMSQGQKEKLKKFSSKIRVISTPVDLEKYNRSDLGRGINDKKIVLHVGRYDKSKDFGTLNKSWHLVKEKMPGVEFIQIGGGDEAKDKLNELEVLVQPQIDHKSLINFYYSADVIVSSSTSESFGKVLVEANACGKPVVATATTGAKEIIQDGYNGFLVPIGDTQALANKILYLLNNPNKAKEMGENGKKLVREKFSDNTKKIIQFWRQLVG